MPTVAMKQTTGLTGSRAHPFTLQIDGLDVIRQAGTAGLQFGVPIESIELHEVVGQPATLRFTVDDPQTSLSSLGSNFRSGAYVYFADHTGRTNTLATGSNYTADLFRGFLVTANATDRDTIRQWECSAISVETLLDRRVIPSGVIASGTNFSTAIQMVMGAYGPAEIRAQETDPLLPQADDSAAYYGQMWDNSGTLLNAVPLSGKTLRQALEDLSRANSQYTALQAFGTYLTMPYVDALGRLIAIGGYYPLAPYALYEKPGRPGDPGNTVKRILADIAVDYDVSNLINAVYVRGVDATSSGWVTAPGSITSNGRYEAFLDAPTAVSSSLRDAIGTAYLNDHQPAFRLHAVLSDTHDQMRSKTDWHVGALTGFVFDAGQRDFLIPQTTYGYFLMEMTRTWTGGGNHSEIRGSWSAPSKSVGALLYQRDSEGLRTSAAGGRLLGTLGEVAVRAKAGIPVDTDFDTPRDGFVVVDTTNNKLWIRSNGVWVQLYGSGANLPNVQVATGQRLRYDPPGALARRTTTQSINTATWTGISMNASEDFDSFGFHDLVTNPSRFTVPAGWGGTYLLVGHCDFVASAAGTGRLIQFGTNGTALGGVDNYYPPSSTITQRMMVADVRELNAGDYVELMVWQDSGGALNANSSLSCYASIIYIGELV